MLATASGAGYAKAKAEEPCPARQRTQRPPFSADDPRIATISTNAPLLDQPDISKSVTIIQRSTGRALDDLKELWQARAVVMFLVWRDMKVRYRQTILGVLWIVI